MACRTMTGTGTFRSYAPLQSLAKERKFTCTVGEELTLHWQDLTIIISLNLTTFLIPYVFDKAVLAGKALIP